MSKYSKKNIKARCQIALLDFSLRPENILEEEGEDENPNNYEQIFEEEYQGTLPDSIVGLQFETRNFVFKGQEVPL